MRKTILGICVVVLIAFALSISSSWAGVSKSTEGDLKMEYSGLELELPIIGKVTTEKTTLTIHWWGRELKVTTPKDRYNHHIKIDRAEGTLKLEKVKSDSIPLGDMEIGIEIISGIMSAHIAPGNPVDVMSTGKAIVLTIPGIPEPVTLENVIIKIQEGKLQFMKFKLAPSAPGRGKICPTAFAKIKSK